MAIKLFTKQFTGVLPDLFAKKTAFLRSFGGVLQVKDGISQSDTFLELKTSDTDVVIQEYSTDENTGFGTGTGSTSRFGERKEVKSVNTSVNYEKPLAINEGIDDFTVNDIKDQVVADRLALHGVAWAQYVDTLLGKALSENASENLEVTLDEASVTKLFSDAHKKFVNNNVSNAVAWVAYVNADVYDLLIDSKLATTAKNSSANVDEQTLYKFKGFILVELPDEKFQTDEVAYFAADNVGVAGIGIQIARAMDSEDFAGTALQAAAKYGKYLPEKNKKAILKGTVKKSIAPTGVTLNKTTLSLAVGANETLTATVTPENAEDKSVQFSSSDTSIATVTPVQGKVTAVAEGTATITVTTSNGKTATCEVTVTPAG